jgi:hypothetical protein
VNGRFGWTDNRSVPRVDPRAFLHAHHVVTRRIGPIDLIGPALALGRDAYQLNQGRLTKQQLFEHAEEEAGGLVAGILGTKLGAILCLTLAPSPPLVILGSIAGGWALDRLGRRVMRKIRGCRETASASEQRRCPAARSR